MMRTRTSPSISAPTTYISTGALLLVLSTTIPAVRWFESEIGPTDLHGPVGLIAALPLLAFFGLGSIVLAVIIVRARVGIAQTLVGLFPLSLLLVVAFFVLLVVGSAG
jgi:hypothetical protein